MLAGFFLLLLYGYAIWYNIQYYLQEGEIIVNGQFLAGLIFLCIVLVLWIMAYRIGVKQQITLLHDYHYQHVKTKDKKAYCRGIGIALVVFSLGFLATAFAFFLDVSQGNIFGIMAIGFIAFLAVFIYVQRKYNGSVF